MSVLHRVHGLTSKKPQKWPVTPGLVAPEWRWAWEGAPFLSMPLWERSGAPHSVVVDNMGTLNNGVSWVDTRVGPGLTFSGTGSEWVDPEISSTRPSNGWVTILTQFIISPDAGSDKRNIFAFGFDWSNDRGLLIQIDNAAHDLVVWYGQSTDIPFTGLSTGTLYTLATSWPLDGGTHHTALNGGVVTDTPGAVSSGWTSDADAIGAEASGTDPFHGEITLAHAVPEVRWSDGQLSRITARDPFGPFRMARRDYIAAVIAAGGGAQTISVPVAPATAEATAPQVAPGAVSISAPGADTLAESTAAQIAASIGLSAPVAPGLANATAPAMSPGDPAPSIAVAIVLANSTAPSVTQGTALAAPVASSTVTSTAPSVAAGPTTVATPAPLVVTSVSAVQFASRAITGSIVYAVASEVAEEVEVKITHPYL